MAFNSLWLIVACGEDRQQCFEVSFCLGWFRWFPGKSYKRIWDYDANGYGAPSILKDKQICTCTWTPCCTAEHLDLLTRQLLGHVHTFLSQFRCSRKANKCEFRAIQPNNWYIFAAFNGGFWAGGSTKRKILSSGLLFKQAPLISLSGPLKQCQMWYHPTLTSKGSVMSSVHL